ncbi:MAG: HAMP domain-containing histidine kinase [Alphaproteobacteria bacterium]|nr:MAG: HAMP domain-containing histidine kinase [Alphaproteobacteria bacterium]
MFHSLSAKLLMLTVGLVMLAEVLIFVPSVAFYREVWLEDHLASGQIAGLALEANPNATLSRELEAELLANAMVRGVMIKRAEARVLMLRDETAPPIMARYDLRNAGFVALMADAMSLIFSGPNGVIEVTGYAIEGGGEYVAIMIDEDMLYFAMVIFARNVLFLSIIISIFTAISLYVALSRLFLQPMEHLTAKMVEFSASPEDASRIIVPSDRRDEIGTAERELEAMQQEISQALVQKTRLASLGEAMTRINHDLRNILTTVHLVSDRLIKSPDPRVQSLSGALMTGIDRAIDLCTTTLSYGKAQNVVPRPILFELGPIVDEIGHSLSLNQSSQVRFVNQVDPEYQLYADPDQIFRMLLNLARNAAEALEDEEGQIVVTAKVDNGFDIIEVADTGPGLPDKAKEYLFTPFQGSTRQGGTGLGLANVLEITKAHGGEVKLIKSDETGTIFCITLPRQI